MTWLPYLELECRIRELLAESPGSGGTARLV